MEIDEAKMEEQDESDPGTATPDRSSGDETENDNGPSGIQSASPVPQGRKSPAVTASSISRETSMQDVELPPPRRELPFTRAATRSQPARKQPAPPAEGDETDEEL